MNRHVNSARPDAPVQVGTAPPRPCSPPPGWPPPCALRRLADRIQPRPLRRRAALLLTRTETHSGTHGTNSRRPGHARVVELVVSTRQSW